MEFVRIREADRWSWHIYVGVFCFSMPVRVFITICMKLGAVLLSYPLKWEHFPQIFSTGLLFLVGALLFIGLAAELIYYPLDWG
ncbi:unnamed protein product, partial [Acanthoscelides obtectus]